MPVNIFLLALVAIQALYFQKNLSQFLIIRQGSIKILESIVLRDPLKNDVCMQPSDSCRLDLQVRHLGSWVSVCEMPDSFQNHDRFWLTLTECHFQFFGYQKPIDVKFSTLIYY